MGTASPFHFNAEDTLNDMIKPARDGTENVVKSAIKAKSERVIVTSSFAASSSFLPEDKPDSGSLYSEEDWNDFIDESIWKETKMQAYIASKSIAERMAWELGKKHGIDVAVIQPVLVMGPVHAPRVEGAHPSCCPAYSVWPLHCFASGSRPSFFRLQYIGEGVPTIRLDEARKRRVARPNDKQHKNFVVDRRLVQPRRHDRRHGAISYFIQACNSKDGED